MVSVRERCLDFADLVSEKLGGVICRVSGSIMGGKNRLTGHVQQLSGNIEKGAMLTSIPSNCRTSYNS